MKNKTTKALIMLSTISIASCSTNINTATTDPFNSFSPSNRPTLENLIKNTAKTKKPTTYIINDNIYSTTYNGKTIQHCDLVSLTVEYANTNYKRTENFKVCGNTIKNTEKTSNIKNTKTSNDTIKNIGTSDIIPSTIENDPTVQNQIPSIIRNCQFYGETESIIPSKNVTIKCKTTDLNRCFLELSFINNENETLIDKKIINNCTR